MSLKVSAKRFQLRTRLVMTVAIFALLVQPTYTLVASQVASAIQGTSIDLQQAIDAAAEGDVINITGPITTSSEIRISKALTINGNNNTITAGHTGVKTGSIWSGYSYSNDNVIVITGGPVTINDLTVDGAGKAEIQGIQVHGTTAILDNVTVRNNTKAGIHANGGANVTARDITTANNGSSFAGMLVSAGSTLTIEGQSRHSGETISQVRRDSGTVSDVNAQYSTTSVFGRTIYTLKSAPAAPTIATPAEAENIVTTSGEVTITWSAVTGVHSYLVSIDGAAPTPVIGGTSLTTTLAAGAHAVTVQSVAQSGLQGGVSQVRNFTVTNPDTAAPRATNISITPRINGNIGGVVTVTFDLEDATGIDLTKTRVLFADGPNTSNAAKESAKFTPVHVSGDTYQVEINTLDFVKANWTGNYNLAFNLWDTLGNHGSSKPADFRSILIDNSGPTSVWIAPVDNSTVNGITRFSFDVSDHTGVKSGYVKLNGPSTKQVNLVQDGASSVWYADINTAELTDGSYTVDARFVDLFDKARYGANKGMVIVDNTAPDDNDGSVDETETPEGGNGGGTSGPRNQGQGGLGGAEVPVIGNTDEDDAPALRSNPIAFLPATFGTTGFNDDTTTTPLLRTTPVTTSDDGTADVLGAEDVRTDWSVVNAALAGFIAILAVVALAGIRRKETDNNTGARVFMLVPAAAAVIAFFVIEDLTGSMIWFNVWTWLFAGILVVQAILATLTTKTAND